MTPRTHEQHALDVAFLLAGAFTARRLYAADSVVGRQTMEKLGTDLATYLDRPEVQQYALGLLSNGFSLAGRTYLSPPSGLTKFIHHLRTLGFEIVTISRGVRMAELEALLALLNLSRVELTALDVPRWLADRGVRNVAVKHVDIEDQDAVRNMRQLYETGRESVEEAFTAAAEAGAMELGGMAELATTMLDLVMRSDVPVATMAAMRQKDDFTYVHSMNVGVLASAQAATLGLDEETIRAVAIAGLVHDVGKSLIPREVFTRDGPLNADEQRMVYAHPTEGARILLRTHGGAGLEAIVAAEHHMSWTDDPHLASQLVAIADTFDAIRSLRPITDRASLRSALNFMIHGTRHRLNPYLLQRFCLMCGMYQPGDTVALATGELARVVSTGTELGTRPVIEITGTQNGRLPVGMAVDLGDPRAALEIAPQVEPSFTTLTQDMVDAIA